MEPILHFSLICKHSPVSLVCVKGEAKGFANIPHPAALGERANKRATWWRSAPVVADGGLVGEDLFEVVGFFDEDVA
jgi:hypothetical protein